MRVWEFQINLTNTFNRLVNAMRLVLNIYYSEYIPIYWLKHLLVIVFTFSYSVENKNIQA